MTSQYNTSSWRDDLDLEPNTHPTIARALHAMRWPFPTQPHYTDRTPPPTDDRSPSPPDRRPPSGTP